MAAQFDFMPAPQTDLNRIYRIDRVTGEVGACQYGQKEGTFGVTLCFPAGDGAGKQEPSEYGLVSSRHDREGGVFRVDMRTGAMSVCYVFDERVVCTPARKGRGRGCRGQGGHHGRRRFEHPQAVGRDAGRASPSPPRHAREPPVGPADSARPQAGRKPGMQARPWGFRETDAHHRGEHDQSAGPLRPRRTGR